jgi:hypothetical protein
VQKQRFRVNFSDSRTVRTVLVLPDSGAISKALPACTNLVPDFSLATICVVNNSTAADCFVNKLERLFVAAAD